MTGEERARAAWTASERVVAGGHPRDAAGGEDADTYGARGAAGRLEARVASLLGKEAAAWMPSGTMAQQTALRVHSDRRGSRTVAFHPHCHLDVHEERGYEHLHGLHAKLLGERNRLVEAGDLEAVHEPLAAVLLELPQRDLGGRLPEWEELVGLCDKARGLGAALHLDGARLWQCGPFYGRGLDEIAALFDTVYVSFYKDLGAPSGCALAGAADVIAAARIWQIRHGGRMFNVHPLLVAAERGLDRVLPRIEAYVAHARELAAALAELDDVSVVPDPPQAAMFHLHVRRPLGPLKEAVLDIAERRRVWLRAGWQPTEDPAVQRLELSIVEANLDVAPSEAADLFRELLELSSGP